MDPHAPVRSTPYAIAPATQAHAVGTCARMPQTDYDGLAIFLAVAEENSFSKAAKRLGVGKGTISRAIASLEQTIGAELIHRTSRAVDDNVVMQENTEAELHGKDINRKREQDFFASIEQFHGGNIRAEGHGGDVSFSEYDMDVTLMGVGRIQMSQVAVRRWNNGKIVHERFYHK
jgi:hypothetical protein